MHITLTHFWDGNKDLKCHKEKINKKKYILYMKINHLLSWIIMPQEAWLFTPKMVDKKNEIISLSFVTLFTRVLKLEGCFLIWCPKTVWSRSHRLKAHYPGELESLRKLREEKRRKRNIYMAWWLELKSQKSSLSQSAYYLGLWRIKYSI